MLRSIGAVTSVPALVQEQRYRRQFLDADRKQTAATTVVIAVSFAATIRNDVVLHGDTSTLRAAVAFKLIHLAATIASLVLARRATSPRRQDRAFAVALAATAAVFFHGMLTRLPSGEVQGPLFGVGALICALYFAHRSPILHRAAVSMVLTAPLLAFVWSPGAAITTVTQATATITLAGLNVLGVFSARSFEENRRKRFAAERDLAVKLRELAVQKERAEAALRARAAFLAMMSHELRTPMNAVIGVSDVLLDAPLAAEHHTRVRVINDSARALLGLLDDVLDFAKIDAQRVTLSPAPFDLRRLAASVVEMLRPAARARSLDLALDLAPGVPDRLLGDEARLRQVLVNLVSNAVKFTDRGGVTVRIDTRAADSGDHEITVRVEDTGIGMTEDVMARLFQPFEQGDAGIARRYGGTGLGLAVSKQIVAAMGADIRVESAPGRGSAFSFTVRLAAAAAPEPAPPARGERPPLAILVVDDHPINRDVARARLGKLGYPVDLASDGPEAIEAVAKKDYDVVFMDLQMPGMSGIEASAMIGEMLAGKRAPRVIAMTASAFAEDREACRRAGMSDLVGKPIDPAQLDAVLARAAEERASTPPVAPLAPEAIADLRRLEALGEPGFFAHVADLFVRDARERFPLITKALAEGDAERVEQEAHVLRSSSASVGATDLAALCRRVEGAARAGRIQEIGSLLEEIEAQIGAVERALAEEIQGDLRDCWREAS